MSNFLIFHPTGLLYIFMHNIPIFEPQSMKLGNMCLNILCYHNCYFGFVNENRDIFILDDLFGNDRILTAVSPKLNEIFCSNFQDFSDLSFTFK